MRRGSSSSGGATGLGFDELLRRDHGRGQQRDSNSRPRQQQQQMIMEPKTNYNNKHELRRGSQDGSHNRNRSNSRQKRMKNPRWRTDVLDRQLREIYMKLLPSKEEIWMKKKCFNKIQKILNKKFKDSALRMFGSSANNLGICKNHDIDLSLEIDISTNDSENENENSSSDSENSNSNSNEDDQVQVRLTQQYVVKTMAKLLRRNRMAKVMPIPKARVPIVKFTEPQTGIECDICVNNLLAVENTVMLRKYSEIDPRLKELVILVKHWSKRRGVNGAFRGTLSSYAYVIMCIHLLQTVQPAILPCLQSSHYQPTINKVVDSWECKYCGDLSHFRNFGALNKSTSAELLYQFFYYWAYQHNYKASVISMRVGDWFSKEDKGWTTRKAGDNHLICIEDPFQLSNDLGRVVSRRTIFFLRDEFKRAADIMGNASDPIRAGLFDILGEAEKEQKLKMHEDSVRSRSKSQ
jgi:DNA polymerase sigma